MPSFSLTFLRVARAASASRGAPDLDDEALLVGAFDRPAFEQRAGARLPASRARRPLSAAGARRRRCCGAARGLDAGLARRARCGALGRRARWRIHFGRHIGADSVMTPSPFALGVGARPAVAGGRAADVGAAGVRGESLGARRPAIRAGGIASGGSASRAGSLSGTSTGIDRGCVSNISGNR
jgi:hypothetical protein